MPSSQNQDLIKNVFLVVLLITAVVIFYMLAKCSSWFGLSPGDAAGFTRTETFNRINTDMTKQLAVKQNENIKLKGIAGRMDNKNKELYTRLNETTSSHGADKAIMTKMDTAGNRLKKLSTNQGNALRNIKTRLETFVSDYHRSNVERFVPPVSGGGGLAPAATTAELAAQIAATKTNIAKEDQERDKTLGQLQQIIDAIGNLPAGDGSDNTNAMLFGTHASDGSPGGSNHFSTFDNSEVINNCTKKLLAMGGGDSYMRDVTNPNDADTCVTGTATGIRQDIINRSGPGVHCAYSQAHCDNSKGFYNLGICKDNSTGKCDSWPSEKTSTDNDFLQQMAGTLSQADFDALIAKGQDPSQRKENPTVGAIDSVVGSVAGEGFQSHKKKEKFGQDYASMASLRWKAYAFIHADWCGHCKNTMPEWLKFVEWQKRRNDDIIVYTINEANPMGEHEQMIFEGSQKFLKGFPCFSKQNSNGEHFEVNSPRTFDGFMAAYLEMLQ